MKNQFTIPQSKNVIVRWFRNNKFTDTLIPRPANNEILRLTMLGLHVGHGEIRAVKADRNTMPAQSTDLLSLAHRWA